MELLRIRTNFYVSKFGTMYEYKSKTLWVLPHPLLKFAALGFSLLEIRPWQKLKWFSSVSSRFLYLQPSWSITAAKTRTLRSGYLSWVWRGSPIVRSTFCATWTTFHISTVSHLLHHFITAYIWIVEWVSKEEWQQFYLSVTLISTNPLNQF